MKKIIVSVSVAVTLFVSQVNAVGIGLFSFQPGIYSALPVAGGVAGMALGVYVMASGDERFGKTYEERFNGGAGAIVSNFALFLDSEKEDSFVFALPPVDPDDEEGIQKLQLCGIKPAKYNRIVRKSVRKVQKAEKLDTDVEDTIQAWTTCLIENSFEK